MQHATTLADAVLLRQQPEGCEVSVTGRDFVVLSTFPTLASGNHVPVVQQAPALATRGQFEDGHAWDGLVHVAACGTKHQPRQRNQDHELARIGSLLHGRCSVDGAGFGRGTPSELRDWISEMDSTSKAIRNLRTPLRSVFEDALNDGLIETTRSTASPWPS